jgi:hypothetical protein
MAILVIEGTEIRLKMSPLERLGALVSPPTARLDQVQSIQFIDELWSKDVLRGVRAPGTGMPYVVLIGVMRGRGYKDFCVIKRRKPGVVITFTSGKYERWIYTLEGSRHAEEQILTGLGPIAQ